MFHEFKTVTIMIIPEIDRIKPKLGGKNKLITPNILSNALNNLVTKGTRKKTSHFNKTYRNFHSTSESQSVCQLTCIHFLLNKI